MQHGLKRTGITVTSVVGLLGAIALAQADFGKGQDLSAAPVGESRTGKMTWYDDAGNGACGTHINAATEEFVALPAPLWANAANPNNDDLCKGVSVEVTYNGKTITVPVKDKCPTCSAEHIDLSKPAFQKLANLDEGVVTGITWKLVNTNGGDTCSATTTTTTNSPDPTNSPVTSGPATGSTTTSSPDPTNSPDPCSGNTCSPDPTSATTNSPATSGPATGSTTTSSPDPTNSPDPCSGNTCSPDPTSATTNSPATSGPATGSMTTSSPATGSGNCSGDTKAPSAPAKLRLTGQTPTSVSLAWDAFGDNVGVTGYEVHVDGSKISVGTNTSAVVGGLSGNAPHTFTVVALDAAGNVSGESSSLLVTLAAAGGSDSGGEGGSCPSAWSGTHGYVPGDVVSFEGHKYTAIFYASGAVPGGSTSWAVWKDDGVCGG
ncbi:cysteine/serine endopeptidase inhibitor [Streptomyces sp. NPDC051172]|uniref:cysteine/serine endopeptidase inhibitor n=1 Tax=Streptomyces sp. NPDC051172 TaxID=3155796 RepID=UPI0034319804